MSGKTGLIVGLMIGLVIASISVVATLFTTGASIKDRESKAWQIGYDKRAEDTAGEQKSISATLNQGLADENARMSKGAQTARIKLDELRRLHAPSTPTWKLATEAAVALGEDEPEEVEEPVMAMTVTAYDDGIGRRVKPASTWKVTHILVSWTGLQVPTKQPRTKDEARKLIDDIWRRYLANPTDDHWRQLQAQHNEDGEPHSVYDSTQSLVREFVSTGGTTKKGFARIVESQFGFHLIRRES